MVMEYSKFGPLNEFLTHNKQKVSLRQLIDVVHGLVRAVVYMVSVEYGNFCHKDKIYNICNYFSVIITLFMETYDVLIYM